MILLDARAGDETETDCEDPEVRCGIENERSGVGEIAEAWSLGTGFSC